MSKLTPDALEALQKSDPAAFDMDEEAPIEAAAESVDESTEAKAARERDESGRFKAKADDAEPEEVPEVKADAAKADEVKPEVEPAPKVNMVPQPRVDELAAERNREREGRLAAERRIAELEAAQTAANTKDFDAEIAALDQKYDDGDIAFADFQKARDGLVADKVRAEVLADVAEKDAKKKQQDIDNQYADASTRFFAAEDNKALVGTRLRDVAFADAVQQVFEAGTAKTYDEVFAQAADIVRRDFPAAAKADEKQEEKPNPQAPRNAADAAAASRASNTPPSINGGVGNRAGVTAVVDLKQIKQGSFSKQFTKEQQEQMLGEGAL